MWNYSYNEVCMNFVVPSGLQEEPEIAEWESLMSTKIEDIKLTNDTPRLKKMSKQRATQFLDDYDDKNNKWTITLSVNLHRV